MPPVHVRFGDQPSASVHSQAAAVLGRALSARLGEGVRFDLDGDVVAAGRPATDLLAQVERGRLTMCYLSTSYLADRVPELALLDLPFVFDRRERQRMRSSTARWGAPRRPARGLDAVALALNTCPRKTLGWRTPAEALDEYLHHQFNMAALQRLVRQPAHDPSSDNVVDRGARGDGEPLLSELFHAEQQTAASRRGVWPSRSWSSTRAQTSTASSRGPTRCTLAPLLASRIHARRGTLVRAGRGSAALGAGFHGRAAVPGGSRRSCCFSAIRSLGGSFRTCTRSTSGCERRRRPGRCTRSNSMSWSSAPWTSDGPALWHYEVPRHILAQVRPGDFMASSAEATAYPSIFANASAPFFSRSSSVELASSMVSEAIGLPCWRRGTSRRTSC